MDIREINKLTRKCYNSIADKYHEMFKDELFVKPFDRSLLDEFSTDFSNDSLVCDAGCGPSAQIGRYLMDKGINVIGTDISDRCIEIAREYNPGMIFYRVDFLDWEFPDEYFDGIVLFYSIIYTPKKYIDEIFSKFRNSLKKNGKILIAVKEGANEGFENEVLGVKTKSFLSYFTKEELRDFLERNGFNVKYISKRKPYNFEIAVDRIYAIGEKQI